MKHYLFPLFFLAFLASATAQLTKTASVEGITEYQMANGLKVLLFPDNSAQTITVNITYLVGSRHEGYGEKGMAHLLEHLVFKGTPKHPDIPKELSARGTRPNGSTNYDRTNYYETFNATEDNLEWALDLEADRMVNSYIAKKDLESEFTVVRNEFELSENDPSDVLMDKVINSAYMWHNYGNATIGNRSDIERVPIENLQAFYKKFYRPDNAVLMVTGKFEEDKTRALIEKKFGKIAKPATPLRDSHTEEPAQDGEKTVAVRRVGDLQIVSALYHTPAGSSPDYAAMSLIEDVLSNEPSGRLYKDLVESQKASSLWSYAPFSKEPGYLYINVDIPSDKNADEVQDILKNTLDNLKDNPITKEELDRAKSNLLKGIDQMNRNSAYLGTYMSEFIAAGDWRLSFLQRDRIEAMTLEAANRVMKKYFIPTNRTTGRFYPTKEPVRVFIPHSEDIKALVKDYKGREAMSTGEAFDVAYDAIENSTKKGTLANGVHYGYIEKKNRGNTVTLNFSGRNGDVNSLSNKGVIPRFTAQMLNKGTTTKTRQQIEDELSRIKSSVSFRGSNGTIYATISSTEENLMPALTLMAELLKNPSFDAAELEKLKTEELAFLESNKTEPQFLASQRLSEINNTYPKGHPLYTLSLQEQEEAIRKLTVADLKSFYSDFYGLGKSILIGIGNLDAAKVSSFIESEFADFKSKNSYTKISDPHKPVKAINENVITPDKQNAMTLGFMDVKISEYHEDYAALNIASTILGGGVLNSRITVRLRQDDGVSYGAGAGFQADGDKGDQNSQFYLYAIYAPENFDKVQLGFKEEIARFIKDGITQEELDDAVNGWTQGQRVSRAKDNELSSLINNNIFYDRDMSFHKDLEAKVAKLTVADVNAAIKKYVKPYDQWSVVNAGDFK